jgi:hypothetical protein
MQASFYDWTVWSVPGVSLPGQLVLAVKNGKPKRCQLAAALVLLMQLTVCVQQCT